MPRAGIGQRAVGDRVSPSPGFGESGAPRRGQRHPHGDRSAGAVDPDRTRRRPALATFGTAAAAFDTWESAGADVRDRRDRRRPRGPGRDAGDGDRRGDRGLLAAFEIAHGRHRIGWRPGLLKTTATAVRRGCWPWSTTWSPPSRRASHSTSSRPPRRRQVGCSAPQPGRACAVVHTCLMTARFTPARCRIGAFRTMLGAAQLRIRARQRTQARGCLHHGGPAEARYLGGWPLVSLRPPHGRPVRVGDRSTSAAGGLQHPKVIR